MDPIQFNPAAYGPAAARILESGSPGLTSLVASATATADLEQSIANDGLFVDAAHPQGALSGLWLYFDCFDAAHKVAQEDNSLEGSFWHAIAHRREPDYGNSSYWFRQFGSHPVYPAIHDAARRLVDVMPEAAFRLGTSKWDPHVFVEYCEEAERSGGERQQFALRVQRAEWEILFDYCAQLRKRLV